MSKDVSLGVRAEMFETKSFPERGEVLDFQLSSEGMRLPNKIGGFKRTQGTETSKYLEERTSTETPLVVASERGPGQSSMCDNWNLSGKQSLRG
jgi:hypothetical protein